MSEVAILGAGAWGIALAIQAARAGRRVELWARDPVRAAELRSRREGLRLPGCRLPDPVAVLDVLPARADIVLLAVPVQFIRTVLTRLPPAAGTLVACCKGMEAGTLRFPLEVVAECQPRAAAAVLSGPNFAHEIARGLPAAAVVAASDATLREQVSAALSTPSFRLYGSADPLGAQIGGAAKNVIAIAAGVVSGAQLGENARAALVTRGLAELARLAQALGARAETVMGLSCLGDLLLTCTGERSRNFSLGAALGRGERLAEILAGRTTVAEGVATAPALLARAAGTDLPICRAVAQLLASELTVEGAVAALLGRPRRDE
ncbi:MAG: NAD(P)-dependent glycerol-3-phosphate dehydrogenase [Acetobacteraceae bacterium]|nr:NAD(P)-dependent glycerol-3-phosphate dehydrogenase [Acetobacteraceae bacterium]